VKRRRHLLAAAALVSLGAMPGRARPQGGEAPPPERRFHDLAVAMRERALSWGDQPYGAVLVLGGLVVGDGPSRVVRDNDLDAHAERVAIRDAQRRLGRERLDGAVLYSTSRPCALCEAAAARAGVARMVFGEALTDAGTPRAR
jgi:tRNA(adenine34) deaminase